MAKVIVSLQTIVDNGDPRDLTNCTLYHIDRGKWIASIERSPLFDSHKVVFVGSKYKTPMRIKGSDKVSVDYLDEKRDVIERWLAK